MKKHWKNEDFFFLFLSWIPSHIFSLERCRCRSIKNPSPFPHLISVFHGFEDVVISPSHISFLPLRVFSCILCDYVFDLMNLRVCSFENFCNLLWEPTPHFWGDFSPWMNIGCIKAHSAFVETYSDESLFQKNVRKEGVCLIFSLLLLTYFAELFRARNNKKKEGAWNNLSYSYYKLFVL